MKWSNLIDNAQKIGNLIAVLVGGLWVYFNYFRGRTFYPRLQLELTGRIVRRGGSNYVLVTMQLKNTGLSRVDIEQEGSGLRISSLFEYANVSEFLSPIWENETS